MMFMNHEYDDHFYAVSSMYQHLGKQLKEILPFPIPKDKPRIDGEHIWFDMHTARSRDPHIVVWFSYENQKRTVEIAINSENKPSNIVIRKKVGDDRFWEFLRGVNGFDLRVYHKNIRIDKRGRLYGISTAHYEWGRAPIYQKMTDEIKPNFSEDKTELIQVLGKFNPDDYEPNDNIGGSPSCNNAIFAFCMIKEYEYDLNGYKDWAKGLNEICGLFEYLVA
jgi:hypothetical protein